MGIITCDRRFPTYIHTKEQKTNIFIGISPACSYPLTDRSFIPQSTYICRVHSCVWRLSKYWLPTYTVTSRDVNFCYPDRVPLTQFVHRAKKIFAIWAWIFCWVFCSTGIFQWFNGKYLSTGWARTFNLPITKQILYHCAAAPLYLWSYNIHVLVARIFRPFL